MSIQLPQGYEEQRTGAVHILARADVMPLVRESVRSAGSLYQYALTNATRMLSGGRGQVPVLETDGLAWAVRHYWRGGAAAGLLRDRYLRFGMPRPQRELEVSSILNSRGVRTPPVIASVVHEDGMWYRGDVATALIPDASDLAELSIGPEPWPEAERERAWFAAGELLRAFVATGAAHADLNLRNIIVQRCTMHAYLLDLDRCTLRERPGPSPESAMLARLHRSRRKLERLHARQVSARELAALKRGRGS